MGNGFSALATVYDSDGSSTNIQYIHDTLAQDGDTITLPAGTFTWNTNVVITKNITIQGAGQDVTIINDNIPKVGGTATIIFYNTGITGNLRYTGFTIHGMAGDPQRWNKGTIGIGGTSHTVRVDHMKFDRPDSVAIAFDGDIWGVVDHCYDDGSNFTAAVSIQHGGWNGDTAGWGDGSYENTLHLGTARGIYIEDCTFVGNTTAGVTDGTRGGRFVFRHNTVTNANCGMHGTEGFRGRGMRSFEIYDNRRDLQQPIPRCFGATGRIPLWNNVHCLPRGD
jgi:hypothetical protein